MADYSEVDKAIERVNKLRDWVGLPITLTRKDGSLYLRGTFPPKDGKGEWKQIRYPLGLKAAMTTIPLARDKGREIGLKLALDRFSWSEEQPEVEVPKKPLKCEEWVEAYEIAHWERTRRTKDKELNYRNDYGLPFARMLDGEKIALRGEPIAIELLRKAIDAYSEPDSRTRKRWCTAMGKLAEFAGLDRSPIDALAGNYSMIRPVNPRDIPDRQTVIVTYKTIYDASPLWARVFGMGAAYGLRPSETWHLDLSDFNNKYHEVLVMKTKTDTERVTYPVPVDWWDLFDLERFRPPPTAVASAKGRGELPSRMYRKFGGRIDAYVLRHFHAVELLLAGIDTATAAKWMGHAPETFQKVYLHWMDKKHHRQIFDRLL